MNFGEMKELIIGSLKAKFPIIQGGMGVGISMSGLASAVANEGGIGVISAAGVGMFDKKSSMGFQESCIEALSNEIKIAKEKTNGILGVNIMVAMTNFVDMVKTAISSKIDVIFAGAGLPLTLPSYLYEGSKTLLVPIISSARAARLLTKKWIDSYNYVPDAFILEGPKAGGHLGFKKEQIEDEDFSLEKILPQVLEALKPFEETHQRNIPVIVAGGIYTGEDIFRFLSMGAAGVQMATRFVTTLECDASDIFKQTYVNCVKEDIRIIESPVGLPGRGIYNAYLAEVQDGKRHPVSCPFDCIVTCEKENAPYCISLALYHAKKGNMKSGFAFAGTNAYRATEIISVKQLFTQIKEEYFKAVSSLHNSFNKRLYTL